MHLPWLLVSGEDWNAFKCYLEAGRQIASNGIEIKAIKSSKNIKCLSPFPISIKLQIFLRMVYVVTNKAGCAFLQCVLPPRPLQSFLIYSHAADLYQKKKGLKQGLFEIFQLIRNGILPLG